MGRHIPLDEAGHRAPAELENARPFDKLHQLLFVDGAGAKRTGQDRHEPHHHNKKHAGAERVVVGGETHPIGQAQERPHESVEQGLFGPRKLVTEQHGEREEPCGEESGDLPGRIRPPPEPTARLNHHAARAHDIKDLQQLLDVIGAEADHSPRRGDEHGGEPRDPDVMSVARFSADETAIEVVHDVTGSPVEHRLHGRDEGRNECHDHESAKPGRQDLENHARISRIVSGRPHVGQDDQRCRPHGDPGPGNNPKIDEGVEQECVGSMLGVAAGEDALRLVTAAKSVSPPQQGEKTHGVPDGQATRAPSGSDFGRYVRRHGEKRLRVDMHGRQCGRQSGQTARFLDG